MLLIHTVIANSFQCVWVSTIQTVLMIKKCWVTTSEEIRKRWCWCWQYYY